MTISARYPLIESVIAAVFVLFYYRELLSGGQNLPVRLANAYNGIVWILLYTKWDLVSIYFFHMTLLVVLLGWGMINVDRFRVPWYAAVGMVASAVALAASFPTLNPVAAKWSAKWFDLPPSLTLSLLGCGVGAAMGLSYEWITGLLRGPSQSLSLATTANNSLQLPSEEAEVVVQPVDPPEAVVVVRDLYGMTAEVPAITCNAMASAALIGSILGIAAAVSIFVLSLMICTAANLINYQLASLWSRDARPIPLTIAIFVVAVAYLALWQQAYGLQQNVLAGLGQDLPGVLP